MAATIVGTAITFGTLGTTAAGVIVNSASKTSTAQKAEVIGPDGRVEALSFYAPKSEISISGTVNGSVTAAVAATLSVAGFTITGGGTVKVDSVNFTSTSEGFKEVEITGTQYPSI